MCDTILKTTSTYRMIIANDIGKATYIWCTPLDDTQWSPLESRVEEGSVLQCEALALPIHNMYGSKEASHENYKGASHSKWSRFLIVGMEGAQK